MKKLKNFIRNKEAATAIEYGLIIALIAVGIITAVASIGDTLSTSFSTVDKELSDNT